MRGLLVVPFLVAVLVIAGTVIAVAPRGSGSPSPLHVAAVFFDGVNNGDARQTCSVWQAGRRHMQECEAYLELLAAMNGPARYVVEPHSTKEWREGKTSVASVRVRGPYGATITARLVKTRQHGWLVVSAK